MVSNLLAYGMPGLYEWIIILVVGVLVGILPVLIFWKICSKAGFPGALGLLMLVPFGNIFLPLYLAFADWPALRGNNA